MNKNFLFKFVVAGALVAAAVLWILQVLGVIGWYSGSVAIAIVSGAVGVGLLCKGLFAKTNSMTLKKLNVYLGVGFLIVTALMIVSILALPNSLVMPIIAIAVAAALLFGLFATGGKSDDTGDNQKAGYKNYYQRKAEEEKKNKD